MCVENPACGGDSEFLYRIVYSKLGRARFFGQLEIATALERAVRRAQLPAAFSKGFHPHVKISFGEALPLGMETLVGEAYLSLTENREPAEVRDLLNGQFQGVIHVSGVTAMEKRPASGLPRKGVYRISGLSPFLVRELVLKWRQRTDGIISKKTKRGVATAALGDVLLDLRKAGENGLEMDLYETVLLCFRPMTVLRYLAGEHDGNLDDCLICKIASYCLADQEGNDDVLRAHYQ